MEPLIVIVGETASGKSALAMELARRFNGELICADSWTVRREANIGTAKPSKEDRARVPHHLLDIVGPDHDFTAAVFKGLANRAISEISSRLRLPIMVGGTGLYIDSVIFNYGFLPEGDRTKREAWNNASVDEVLDEVQARGLSTEGIDICNKRRLIRLIETGGQRPAKSDLRSNTLILGLKIDREILNHRIERRVDAMLTGGLENEVLDLVDRYGWDCEALKGIGYREWQAYYSGDKSIAETRASIIKSTQDLAKRQRTWFKRNSFIQWVDDPEKAVDIVTTFLNKKQ